MKPYKDIVIDFTGLDNLKAEAKANEGVNPGCMAIHYWSGRMNLAIEQAGKQAQRLGYGFVGDGWPCESDQSMALQGDTRNLQNAFLEHHYRDAGDAIYQANTILDHMNNDLERTIIADIGGGYGRLAIPLLYYLRPRITYIDIDYVPVSLLIAPQFVCQAINAVVDIRLIASAEFIALPAWKIEDLKDTRFNAFVSVHSMQEMTREAVLFYLHFIGEHAADSAIFYCVNIGADEFPFPSSWTLISRKPYPINRDGAYYEMIFRVK